MELNVMQSGNLAQSWDAFCQLVLADTKMLESLIEQQSKQIDMSAELNPKVQEAITKAGENQADATRAQGISQIVGGAASGACAVGSTFSFKGLNKSSTPETEVTVAKEKPLVEENLVAKDSAKVSAKIGSSKDEEDMNNIIDKSQRTREQELANPAAKNQKTDESNVDNRAAARKARRAATRQAKEDKETLEAGVHKASSRSFMIQQMGNSASSASTGAGSMFAADAQTDSAKQNALDKVLESDQQVASNTLALLQSFYAMIKAQNDAATQTIGMISQVTKA